MMNNPWRNIAFAALIGFSAIQAVSAHAAETYRVQDGLQAQFHIFFDPQKYRAWTEGKGRLDEATAVPAKLADVPFLVMVAVGDCKAGANGKCNVTADYTVFGPGGEKIVDNPGRRIWTKAAKPKGRIVAFSEDPVSAMLQSSDPPGSYRFHVVLHDNNADTTLEMERVLMLEARQ